MLMLRAAMRRPVASRRLQPLPPAAASGRCLQLPPTRSLLHRRGLSDKKGPPSDVSKDIAKETPMSRAEMQKVVQNAKDEEKWMNTLMPERNWGMTSPVTWVMFATICVLFVYNNRQADRKEKEEAEKRVEDTKRE